MTVDEMYKALNKGLPVYLIVELDVDTLVNSCASDRAALINSIRKIKKNYQDAIVNLAGYSKAQHYFFKKLMAMSECFCYLSHYEAVDMLSQVCS